MGEKKRLDYFDIAKGIGIILVIIGHIEYVDQAVRNVIVSFHMPLFFILSGMLMRVSGEKDRSLKKSLEKKLKRIMLPYLAFSLLYPCIDFMYYFVTGNGDPGAAWKTNLTDSLLLYGNSVLWFLPAVFFGEVLWLVYIRLMDWLPQSLSGGRKAAAALLMSAALMLLVYIPLWRSQDHFIQAFVRFFICAFLAGQGYCLYPHLTGIFSKKALSILVGAALLILTCFISRPNGTVDMHFAVYGNLPLFFFTALCGSLGILFISAGLNALSQTLPFRILHFYGIHSLFIMITHINFYVLYVSEVLAFHFAEYVTHAKLIVFNGMVVLFVLIGEYILIVCWEAAKRAAGNFLDNMK